MTSEHDRTATRARARVALVTCADLPELEPDDQLVLAPLAARGVVAEPVVWDAPDVDWGDYDLAVLRSPWDYVPRRDEFVAWARRVPALANPALTVRWNTDKRYLRELAAAGVPTVPTDWLGAADEWTPPETGEYVVKPAVSAGSQDTGRYDLADADQRALAVAHVARLQAADRLVMVQPYLDAVDTYGETALLFLAGPDGLEFSHAIRKGAMLTGPDAATNSLYQPEKITPRTPSDAEHAAARQVLAALPEDMEPLLYARVDLIPGADGTPILVELELTEPSLFLGHADGAADRLADAIVRRLP
ncbi:hypothetical protein SAMN05444365_105350 [Micromonospora pattaloongensis]|uniref:ATP-grasp domain-containing protein n=1 Tax=Micromonospora pattaloongensis TaxID=405436 RepID=A0A1H3QBA8_9ACTN|nr:hypothetical protein [Micromonospora pattaloongensis]SDZ10696.1 hypothetical protein SAMN05444365_105350 [Micromonospora pattaloongensis]